MPAQATQLVERKQLGHFHTSKVGGELVRCFIPPPLPPDPPVQLTGMINLLAETTQILGQLDGMSTILPNPLLFVYTYVRKEAVVSSQIEGTQSSLSDLLMFENEMAPGVPEVDVREVSNYVAAMDHGLKRMAGGFPLSLRLIREIHGILLADGRGAEKRPGEFRTSQNWIGGTRPGNAFYVPPPPDQLMNCLGPFEQYLHSDDALPLLVKAAMVHVQFESIHPFLDGNGRIGRLLIPLMLYASNTLRQPTLYLSLYLKQHRQTYYDLLTRVRETGDWETWITFFLEGVRETSKQAASSAVRILRLQEADRARIEKMGRPAPNMLRLHQHLQEQPVMSIGHAAKAIGLTFPTVSAAAERLVEMGILREVTNKARGRAYFYDEYMKILSEGTEPLPR